MPHRHLQLREGCIYHMGASRHPDSIRVYGFESMEDPRAPDARFMLYEELPIRSTEPSLRRIDERVARALVATGTRNRLEGQVDYLNVLRSRNHSDDDLADLKRDIIGLSDILETGGVNQKPVPREECARYCVFIAQRFGEPDLWGAIDKITGGCCNGCTIEPDEHGDRIYECTSYSLDTFRKLDETFRVVRAKLGEADVLDELRALSQTGSDEAVAADPQPASGSTPQPD